MLNLRFLRKRATAETNWNSPGDELGNELGDELGHERGDDVAKDPTDVEAAELAQAHEPNKSEEGEEATLVPTIARPSCNALNLSKCHFVGTIGKDDENDCKLCNLGVAGVGVPGTHPTARVAAPLRRRCRRPMTEPAKSILMAEPTGPTATSGAA